MYMEMAYSAAARSYARRRKVGAILVTPEDGRFEGINGMPAGFDNNCEIENPDGSLRTKQECLHAESNALAKVGVSTSSSKGATIYCTLSPCLECAKLIVQHKIKRVVFSEQYPYPGHDGLVRTMGFDLLEEAGIQVDMLNLSSHNVDDDEITLQDEGRSYDDGDAWRSR